LSARWLLSLLAIGLLAAPTGCGSGGASSSLTVSAASSLTAAFTRYGTKLHGANPRFSFAGSDVLAAQIQQGARPDVFASANTAYPAELHDRGLVGKPVVFAANRLVIAVPADSPIRSARDLTRPGTTIAIGSPSVPVGEYTHRVLSGLGPKERSAILDNVRSEEPDVAGVIGKLTQGAVDAGFAYATDVVATRGALRAVELPRRLRPSVAYAATVVKGTDRAANAREFIRGLVAGRGARALRRAGFEPPPR
jgi:molybdate transport system substrate-binding protein